MEVPFGFIFLALVLLVAMSFLLGWIVARSLQPVGTGTNITWFSGAPPADANETPAHSPQGVRSVAGAAQSQSECRGSGIFDPVASVQERPVIIREELTTQEGEYWINPKSWTMHRNVELCGPERNLMCGSHQCRRLEQVYLCNFCWPSDTRKSR